MQNTAQNALAAATPPVFGLLIGAASYGSGFAVAVLFPALACLLVPVSTEKINTEKINTEKLSDRRAVLPEPR